MKAWNNFDIYEPKSRDFGSIWAVGLVVQLTSAAVADVAGSHAATTVVCSTVARQTALGFRHSDEVVSNRGLQAVEPPSAQPFHNSDDASNDCAPLTVDFRNVQQFLLYTARFDDCHVL